MSEKLTETQQAALTAANKIMHEPPPHNEDEVQLVAGELLVALITTAEDYYPQVSGSPVETREGKK